MGANPCSCLSPRQPFGHVPSSSQIADSLSTTYPRRSHTAAMIIVPEGSQDPTVISAKQAPLISTTSLQNTNDPPPQYEPPASSVNLHRHGVKALNHISIVRQMGSLDDTYVIDPTLQVPSSLLPDLAPGESEDARRHLNLQTKAGSIAADVLLVDKNLNEHLRHKSGRVTMVIDSVSAGSIVVKIHASHSNNRFRFHLSTYTCSGSITLSLPRSFQGPIIISVPLGFVSISASLSSRLTTVSEAGHVRRCFVGDLSLCTSPTGADDTTQIDEVRAETKVGNVTLLYDDEEVSDEKAPESFVKLSSGLFGKMFGRWA